MEKTKRRVITVLGLVLLTLFFGYWAYFIQDRSPIEDLLLDKNNSVVQGDARVKGKKEKGFNPSDPIIAVTDTRLPGWMYTLCDFEEYASKIAVVLGFCKSPYFEITPAWDPDLRAEVDEINTTKPFLNLVQEVVGPPEIALPKNWREKLSGSMMMKSFTAQGGDFLVSAVFTPQSGSELKQAKEGVKLLQKGAEIPWWRLWDIDIHSAWPGIIGTGWLLGRYIIHVLLIASTIMLLVVGTGTVVFALFRIFLCSTRLAIIGVLHIWIALIWEMGAMALFGIHRSVFTLLGQGIVCLMGTSQIHKMFQNRKASVVIWQVAIIAFLGSILLLQFKVTQIHELAYSMSLGILVMTALSTWSFPIFLREGDVPRYTGSWSDIAVRKLTQGLKRAAFWFGEGMIKQTCLIAGIIAIFFFTAWLIMSGAISTATNSHDYIRRTSISDGLNILDGHEGPGQVFLESIVECRDSKTINDVVCARDMILWLRAVEEEFAKTQPKFRTAISLLKVVEEAAVGNRDKEGGGILGRLPETDGDIAVIWPSIKTAVIPYKHELYCWHDDSCFRVLFGVSIQTDMESYEVLEALREFNKMFPGVTITFFGKNVLFTELWKYVTTAKVVNIFSSNGMVIATMFFLILWWQRGKHKRLSPLLGSLVAVIPFLFAPSIFLLLVWLGKNPLDAVTATISAFAIAAAGDFVVYFLHALVENLQKYPHSDWLAALEITYNEISEELVKDMILNIGAFSLLPFFVYFAPVQTLGIALAIITLLCLVGTLVVMTASLVWTWRPKEAMMYKKHIPLEMETAFVHD